MLRLPERPPLVRPPGLVLPPRRRPSLRAAPLWFGDVYAGHSAAAGGGAGETDPFWDEVVLLAPFDEADEATSFTDYSDSAHSLTANGNVKTDDVSPPAFQSTSLLLPGSSGDFVSAADSADWNFGSGDFTVEYFGDHDVTDVDAAIVQWNAGANDRGWGFFEGTNLEFFWSTNGTDSNNMSASFTGSGWTHRMASRVGNTLHLGSDGTIIDTADVTGVTLNDSGASMVVGANNNGSSAFYDGNIAAVRITKGTGRYSGSVSDPYTVPTPPYPTA